MRDMPPSMRFTHPPSSNGVQFSVAGVAPFSLQPSGMLRRAGCVGVMLGGLAIPVLGT